MTYKYLAIFLGLAFSLPALSEQRTVSAKIGTLLYKDSTSSYYLKSDLFTEISYANPLVAKDASVVLELRKSHINPDNTDFAWEDTELFPMVREGKAWKVLVKHYRHGFGASDDLYLYSLKFRVSYDNQESFVLEQCGENAERNPNYPRDYFFQLRVASLNILPGTWFTQEGQIPELKETDVSCTSRSLK